MGCESVVLLTPLVHLLLVQIHEDLMVQAQLKLQLLNAELNIAGLKLRYVCTPSSSSENPHKVSNVSRMSGQVGP